MKMKCSNCTETDSS